MSAVVLAFLAVLLGLAAVVFRNNELHAAQAKRLRYVRDDVDVLSADVDFLFSRLADIDSMLHGRSVLGSDATDAVRDWVSSAHVVLDDVQERLNTLKS